MNDDNFSGIKIIICCHIQICPSLLAKGIDKIILTVAVKVKKQKDMRII